MCSVICGSTNTWLLVSLYQILGLHEVQERLGLQVWDRVIEMDFFTPAQKAQLSKHRKGLVEAESVKVQTPPSSSEEVSWKKMAAQRSIDVANQAATASHAPFAPSRGLLETETFHFPTTRDTDGANSMDAVNPHRTDCNWMQVLQGTRRTLVVSLTNKRHKLRSKLVIWCI